MEKNRFKLVIKILNELDRAGVLSEVILIGSWAQLFYGDYFEGYNYRPDIRTVDIDFLISRPNKLKKEIDIPEVLKKLEFEESINSRTGWVKYVHPELDLEFLTPKLGRGINDVIYIKKYHINAVALRYLNLISDYTIKVNYNGIKITVPEPAAFALHKLIISTKRLKAEKKNKDLETAFRIGNLLASDTGYRKRMTEIYYSFPGGWQRTLKKIFNKYSLDWID